MAALPDELDERITTLEESLSKLEEELDPLLSTPWEQLTRCGPASAKAGPVAWRFLLLGCVCI